MTYAAIEVRTDDHIGVIAFNRPRVLNAFDPVLIEETSRALALGIVNRLVPEGQALDEAMAIARDIAAAAPASVQMTKRAINRSYEMMGMRQALLQALETDIFIEASGGPECDEFNRIRAKQGLKAALASRDARFARGAV